MRSQLRRRENEMAARKTWQTAWRYLKTKTSRIVVMKNAVPTAAVARVRFFSMTLVPLNVSLIPPPNMPETPPLPEWSKISTTSVTERME